MIGQKLPSFKLILAMKRKQEDNCHNITPPQSAILFHFWFASSALSTFAFYSIEARRWFIDREVKIALTDTTI
jgi:hypothetical protein